MVHIEHKLLVNCKTTYVIELLTNKTMLIYISVGIPITFNTSLNVTLY